MADEKVTLIEVDINIEAAAKGSKKLAEEVSLLKDQTAKAKKEQGEFSQAYIQSNAALKSAQKEQRTQNNLIEKSISSNKAATGSIDQLRSQLAVTSVQWAKLSGDQRKNTEEGKKLTKQKLDLTNALKKEEAATGDTRREVGNYALGMKDSVAATTSFSPAAGKAAGIAKSLGSAFKVMLGPIGLVVAAFAVIVGSLKAFFTSSEKGQNVLKKLQAVFQVVFGNIIDLASKLGEVLVNAFTKPQEAIANIKTRVKEIGDFFQNTFGNIIGGAIQNFVANLLKGFANIGLAWQKVKGVFTDNAEDINKAQDKITALNDRIEESNERIKKGAEALGKSVKAGWDKAKEGLSGFIAEQEREIDIAKRLADQQANLDKQIRDNLVLEAKDRLAIAKIKNQIQDKENNDAQTRLDFIEEEGKLLDDIFARNLNIAKQKLEIKKAQDSLSLSTKEDLDEEAQLLADIFKLETTIEQARKASITKRVEAEKELLAAEQAKVEDAVILLQEEIDRKNEILDEEKERKIEQEAIDFENEFAIREGNLFGILELERQHLELQRQQEIDLAKKTGADVAKIDKKFTKAARALDVAELQGKLALAQSFTANIAQIAGEQTAIGKAAAVASATVSAIQGAISSYTSLAAIPVVGPVLGAVAAAAALAAGYAQVKNILSVKSGLPGDSGVSASIPSASPPSIPSVPSVQPENVNPEIGAGIVTRGADDPTSQAVANGVSTALEENPLQPVLVENDVTVAQEDTFDNNETVVI